MQSSDSTTASPFSLDNELSLIATRLPAAVIHINANARRHEEVNYQGKKTGVLTSQGLLCACCRTEPRKEARLLVVSLYLCFCYPCYQRRRLAFLMKYALLIAQLPLSDYRMQLSSIACPLFSIAVAAEHLFGTLEVRPPISRELMFMTPWVPYRSLDGKTWLDPLTLQQHYVHLRHVRVVGKEEEEEEERDDHHTIARWTVSDELFYYHQDTAKVHHYPNNGATLYVTESVADALIKLNGLIGAYMQSGYRWLS